MSKPGLQLDCFCRIPCRLPLIVELVVGDFNAPLNTINLEGSLRIFFQAFGSSGISRVTENNVLCNSSSNHAGHAMVDHSSHAKLVAPAKTQVQVAQEESRSHPQASDRCQARRPRPQAEAVLGALLREHHAHAEAHRTVQTFLLTPVVFLDFLGFGFHP